MRTVYKVKQRTIHLNNTKERIKLWCFGDIHRFTKSCDEDRWKWFLTKAKESHDENTFYLGLGDYCLPLDTQILTLDGWKQYHELSNNEIICGYNAEKNQLEWQRLISIYFSPLQQINRLKSKSFDFRCTNNHQWFTTTNDDKEKDSTTKIPFKNLRSYHRIRVVAPMFDQTDIKYLDVTPHECYLLGWIVTDGSIRYKKTFSVNISQSPKKYLNQLKNEFADIITGSYKNSMCDCETLNIKVSVARKLFEKFGFTSKDDLPFIASRLNKECRKEMLRAFKEAEGWVDRNWCFAQLDGGVLEAYRILSTLEGQRIGLSCKKPNGVVTHKESPYRNITFFDLSITMEGEEAVWCPITPLGSIVARQGNCITITGNCEFASAKEQKALIQTAGLHEQTIEDFGEMVSKRNRALAMEMSFMKPNILGLIDGNHNWIYSNGKTGSEDLAERLSTEYLGWLCHYTLNVKIGKSQKTSNVYIVACHGRAGGRTAGATVNQVAELRNIFPVADIYIEGHDHQRWALPNSVLVPTFTYGEGVVELKQKRQFYCRSGSFKKGYSENESGYEIGRLLKPADLGALLLDIGFHYDLKGDRLITDIQAVI